LALLAMNAATNPAVRIAVLIASFAFVETFMIVLLLDLGFCFLARFARRKCLS
jgi:hypothetical protein